MTKLNDVYQKSVQAEIRNLIQEGGDIGTAIDNVLSDLTEAVLPPDENPGLYWYESKATILRRKLDKEYHNAVALDIAEHAIKVLRKRLPKGSFSERLARGEVKGVK